MGRAQRDKGKRGELEVAALLTSFGFPARRSARNGVAGAEDVVCDALPDAVIEVKNHAAMRLGTAPWDDAWHRAVSVAASRGRRAVMFWRCARGAWAMTHGVPGLGAATVVYPDDIRRALVSIAAVDLGDNTSTLST